jgi:tRNA uridine 5-carboxymethylaminomethyl modification enzyme
MFHVEQKYSVVVIGGGHAGVEAVSILDQFSIATALITLPNVPIGSAPCNPSVGGVGKGQVVRELDALGGIMPYLSDLSGIQYRTLNESKGLAVQSTRVQIDKDKYAEFAGSYVRNLKHVKVIEGRLNSISKSDNLFKLHISENVTILAEKVIITAGTFLGGKLHQGEQVSFGGRVGTEAVSHLKDIFSEIKYNPKRFKTGTPARLFKGSVDTSVMIEQPSDSSTFNFSHSRLDGARNLLQVSCYLTRTNANTLKFIRDNKERSPMYNGQINGVGARYCPSIEDKAYRYPDKNDHHVFVEPEGLDCNTYYPSGISSSLPVDVQDSFLRSISGFENCEIQQYGYAVEYDVVDTQTLKHTLESKDVQGLYFAGQLNGTSGYEEAAGQGFIAGANAALMLLGKEPLVLNRNNSYIGVMIDDLVTMNRDEPYRLFTARAENRLNLREDNVYTRLGPIRLSFGLQNSIDIFIREYLNQFDSLLKFVTHFQINRHDQLISELAIERIENLPETMKLAELLKQSWLDPVDVLRRTFEIYGFDVSRFMVQQLAIEAKYFGYIQRLDEQNAKLVKIDNKKIQWEALIDSKNISFECRQRIKKVQPTTFGQLKRIEGIRPATLAVVAGDAY